MSELCELDEGLSPWEVTFIDDMSKWKGDYTSRQAEKIEDVYQKHT